MEYVRAQQPSHEDPSKQIQNPSSKDPEDPKRPFYRSGAFVGSLAALALVAGGGGILATQSNTPNTTASNTVVIPQTPSHPFNYATGEKLQNVAQALDFVEKGYVAAAAWNADTNLYSFALKDGKKSVVSVPALASAEDTQLTQALNKQKIPVTVTFNKVNSGSGIKPGSILLWAVGLLVLFMGIRMWRNRKNGGGGGGAGGMRGMTKSPAKQYNAETAERITFKDVKGQSESVSAMQDLVLDVTNQKKGLKIKRPHGALLYGPPGTGKTLLAKAVAGEAGVPFYSMSGSDFVEMFVGVGASRVRNVFEEAKKNAPCILFIDELEAVGRARSSGPNHGQQEQEGTLNQILVELDGFIGSSNVYVIGATNRPDLLDEALTRPGRLEKQVPVNNPRDWKARLEILQYYADKLQEENKEVVPDLFSDDIDLKAIAQITIDMSPAKLESLIFEAANLAQKDDADHPQISQKHLTEAIHLVLLGPANRDIGSDRDREIVACHEDGHYIVGRGAGKSFFVKSNTPRSSGSLGHVLPLPSEDLLLTQREMLADILMRCGGRAAEEVRYGKSNITSGAAMDFKQVTDMVKNMLMTAMFDNSLSDYRDPSKPLSESDQKLLNDIVDNAMNTATAMIRLIPPDTHETLVTKSLESDDLLLGEIDEFYDNILGPNFDWGAMEQLVEEFIADPTGIQLKKLIQAAEPSMPEIGPRVPPKSPIADLSRDLAIVPEDGISPAADLNVRGHLGAAARKILGKPRVPQIIRRRDGAIESESTN